MCSPSSCTQDEWKEYYLHKDHVEMQTISNQVSRPTPAYLSATWAALAIGVCGYLLGLWNADIMLNEKGYYFAIFILALFSSVTLQKTVRDKQEGLPATKVFVGMCWAAFFSSIALLGIGLFNAEMALSEKGFYVMAFILSLFSIVTVQKNVRDLGNKVEISSGINQVTNTPIEANEVLAD